MVNFHNFSNSLLFIGIVIQMIDDRMSPATAKTILQGTADPLNSAFHLTYNMVMCKKFMLEGGGGFFAIPVGH